jgi:hypothetical protein
VGSEYGGDGRDRTDAAAIRKGERVGVVIVRTEEAK